MVRDHQRIGPQRHLLSVEQYQGLTFGGHAYADSAFDLLQIEGVEGLPQLEHHVVGNVHHSIDAANTGPAQALDLFLDPRGAAFWTQIAVFPHQAGVLTIAHASSTWAKPLIGGAGGFAGAWAWKAMKVTIAATLTIAAWPRRVRKKRRSYMVLIFPVWFRVLFMD